LLESFDVGLEEAQAMVMNARVMLGWLSQEELDAQNAPEEEEGEEDAPEAEA